MKLIVSLTCSSLLLIGSLSSLSAEDSYSSVYSSPEASAELPANLFIAKGLPLSDEGNSAAQKAWDSYRTPTARPPVPARKLTPVRAAKAPAPVASRAAPVVHAPRE